MSLKDVLQGKPLGHPSHPMFVHFPTALFPTSLLFDLLSWGIAEPALVKAAFYNVAVALVVGVLATSARSSQGSVAKFSSQTPSTRWRGKKITSEAYNHVALVPAIFQVHFLQEHGLNIINPNNQRSGHQKLFKNVLNSSDYRFLRTSELKL